MRRIITIHGVWKTDFMRWQEDFKDFSESKITGDDVQVFNYSYGLVPGLLGYFMGVLKFLSDSVGFLSPRLREW